MDGQWQPPKAAVTLRQPETQAFALFVLVEPFGYLSLGPTNECGLEVRSGEVFRELYQIEVVDLPGE